jgi:hypothetical protein
MVIPHMPVCSLIPGGKIMLTLYLSSLEQKNSSSLIQNPSIMSFEILLRQVDVFRLGLL